MSKKKQNTSEKRILKTKEDHEEYGMVTKALGGGNFKIKLNLQNKEVIGKVRGNLKKG
jgi:translation initiation factor IF-1